MGVDDERIKEIADVIDPKKLCGRYIHFGNIISDYKNTNGASMNSFFEEIVILLRSFLTQFTESDEQFLPVKASIVESLYLVTSVIASFTREQLDKIMKHALKIANQNIDLLKKTIGKDQDDFFL